jgi:tetratricopeptide (TPR) repeat protein
VVTKKDKHLAAAQKLLERGQLDKALVEFAKVVQDDPKDTRTWLKMAELHAKRGAADQATEIYLKTGELYTEQGFFQKAVAVYKNVLKLSPSCVVGHVKLAEVYARLGLVSDAVQQYEQAAFGYQKAGRPAEVLDALRAIVALNPDNVVSRIKLAESASQAGATDDAIQEFAKAAEQLKTQGRSDEYVRVAERLLFHQPDNVSVARELAEAYIAKNNPRLALARLQACLKAEPRAPENVSLLARAFEQLDVPKAVSVLRELAQIHHGLGQTAERDAAIRKALALDPRDAEAQDLARRHGILLGLPPPLPPGVSGARALGTPPPLGSGAFSPPPLPPGARRGGGYNDPPSGVRAGAVLPPSGQDVSRIMAESDVFVKYGLLDRAVDHLRRAFDVQPDFLPAREKLAAVLTQLGRKGEAAAELEFMAENLARTDRAQAAKLAERALVLDPGAPRARLLLDQIGVELDTPPPVEPVAAREPPRPPQRTSPTLVAAHLPAPRPPSAPARPPAWTAAGDAADAGGAAAPARGASGGLELDLEAGDDDPVLDLATAPPRPATGGAGAPGVVADGDDDVDVGVAAAAGDADLMAELEQVDFFIEQSLPDDAFALVDDLRARYPGHPLVEAKLAEVRRVDATPPPAAPPPRERAAAPVVPLPAPRAAAGLGAVPSAAVSRNGHARPERDEQAPVAVVAGGEKADLSTHGDLGIAYKEMGLLDAAIGEFRQLTQDPKREVFALTMIGECCEAKGSLTDAIIRYKEALNCPQVTPEETIQLYFCLGSTFERLSDRSEALYFFEKVAKRDPGFRDVSDRISKLRPPAARQV